MNRSSTSRYRVGDLDKDPAGETGQLTSISEINDFPFESFEELQAAVGIRSFNVGVDALAAARWSDEFNSKTKRAVVGALSLLLLAAGLAAIGVSFVTRDYWLLMAVPIQAFTFYLSHPASPIRKWVTVGGALSIAAFVDLLLNGLLIAATLVAYAGLTFAAVRAAGYISNAGFRKAILTDEQLFLEAYAAGACTVRNNRTGRIYSK